MPPVRLLAISGSLRAASLNSALLRAVVALAPSDVCVELYTGLGNLPLFNPDLEITDSPAVADFYARVLEADGVIIASPEYAHGVTGVDEKCLGLDGRQRGFCQQTGCVTECVAASHYRPGIAQRDADRHVGSSR